MALQLQPASGHPYELMGYSQLERKEFLKAILSFDSAISKDKTLYKAYVNKAAALSHLSRYAEALTVLDQVITLKPDYLLEHKFRLQQVTGDLTGDLSTLNQCIKYCPDSAMLYNIEKTYIYDALHDYTSACRCAFAALKDGLEDGYDYIVKPQCAAYKKQPLVMAEPFILQSQKEYASGMFYAEIATLTKAIALLPDSASLYYNRGGGKRQLNDFAAAIVDYSKAIRLRPKFRDAIVARAVAKTYLNDITGAMTDYQLAIKVDPTYAIAYHNYALLLAQSDAAGAIDYLTKAIQYNKKYASAYLSRGKIYLTLEKKEAACVDFKKAEALGSDDAKVERLLNCK